jgi:hypothetical protein
VIADSGLVWSMNCESWLEPKNSLTTAVTGLAVDQVVRHQRLDLLERHALLDRPLHAHESDPVLVLEQLADHAHAPVAEVVDVVDPLVGIGAVLELDQVLHRGEDVVGPQRRELGERDLLLGRARPVRLPAHALLGIEAELVVDLEPADLREVVALRVEEQVAEQVRRRLDRRRIAGAAGGGRSR